MLESVGLIHWAACVFRGLGAAAPCGIQGCVACLLPPGRVWTFIRNICGLLTSVTGRVGEKRREDSIRFPDRVLKMQSFPHGTPRRERQGLSRPFGAGLGTGRPGFSKVFATVVPTSR